MHKLPSPSFLSSMEPPISRRQLYAPTPPSPVLLLHTPLGKNTQLCPGNSSISSISSSSSSSSNATKPAEASRIMLRINMPLDYAQLTSQREPIYCYYAMALVMLASTLKGKGKEPHLASPRTVLPLSTNNCISGSSFCTRKGPLTGRQDHTAPHRNVRVTETTCKLRDALLPELSASGSTYPTSPTLPPHHPNRAARPPQATLSTVWTARPMANESAPSLRHPPTTVPPF